MRQWLNKGVPDVIGQARKIAKKRIAQHDYLLDEETRRELDSIYARAAE